jgi:hypothetical protein
MKPSLRLTKIDAVALIFGIAFLSINVFALTAMEREFQNRTICATNLKGLDTAMNIYAFDYDDEFPKQGGSGNAIWSETTDDWQNPAKMWTGDNKVTIGASLYMLVREADVSPISFICPSSTQVAYEGQNSGIPELTNLWDFGSVNFENTGPKNCVSYSYHMPYSNYAADASSPSSFAVMADKSPWYDSQLRKGEPTDFEWKQRVGYIVWDDSIRGDRDWQIEVGNAQTHLRQGQNVSYGDGHISWEIRSDVGFANDNIYTTKTDSTSDGIRIGAMPDPYGIGLGEPSNGYDSFLVNDDAINPCYTDQPGDLNKDCAVDIEDLSIISKHWMESTKQD